MKTRTTNAVRSGTFAVAHRSRRRAGLRAAALLLAVLAGFAGRNAEAQAQQQSPGTEATGDGSLYFWAVNEGGARIYRPDAGACSRIRGLSAQYADAISGRYHVPAYTLKVLAVRPPEGSAGCVVLLDTPDGTRECRLGSVMKTFGGSYLAHTYAQEPDGSVRYVAGDCR